jgi:hypothetical protein
MSKPVFIANAGWPSTFVFWRFPSCLLLKQFNASRGIRPYNNAKLEYNCLRDEQDYRRLLEADIVGVTSTGLAQNLNLLHGAGN